MRPWFFICLVVGALGAGLLWLMGADTSTPGSAMPIGGLFQMMAVAWGLLCLLVGLV